MRIAAAVPGSGAPFEMHELELDDPGPDEVVVVRMQTDHRAGAAFPRR